jgi:hypothetical protein
MNKKLLLSLALTAGIFGSAIAGKTYCLTNSFGEQTTLTITGRSGTVYTVKGLIDYSIFGSTQWPCEGTYDKATQKLHYVATNPNPDNCTFFANTVTFDYTGKTNFSGTFSNECGNAGSLNASAVAGSCGFNPVKMKAGEYGSTGSNKMSRSQLPVPAGIDFAKSLSFNAISVSPNPVVREAQVSVTLASASKITVGVYNQNGSLIRILAKGDVKEGTHTYTWNLQTQNGTKVKSGYYIVKLTSDGSEQSTQIVVTE